MNRRAVRRWPKISEVTSTGLTFTSMFVDYFCVRAPVFFSQCMPAGIHLLFSSLGVSVDLFLSFLFLYKVVGIIDYMRQYDIIKRMERMSKSVSMIAGQAEPTIVQPSMYKTRFQQVRDWGRCRRLPILARHTSPWVLL